MTNSTYGHMLNQKSVSKKIMGESDMPFKSVAQQRFMFSQKPKLAHEFQKETPSGIKLPEKAKPKKFSSYEKIAKGGK